MKLDLGVIAVIAAIFITTVDASATLKYRPYKEPLSPDSFFEQFDSKSASRWIPSNARKVEDDQLSYVGEWAIEESIVLNGVRGDRGLVTKTEAALHAVSMKLPNVFDNTNNTLVLQYEVKLQNGLNCGGAYVKLLSQEGFDEDKFSDGTPYLIMFGPDRCGDQNKVHFIIKTWDDEKKELVEHQIKAPPMMKMVQLTSLYTLIVEPNQNFEIRINGEIVRSGNLLNSEDFDILPPKEIIDVNDVKPDDWVDEPLVEDRNATKPDDWDETEPYLIDDPNARIPEDWDEEAPDQIPDPNYIKPDDWDDEEDGIWEPRLIDNPACLNHGCGKWIRPKIKNPKYRGKWRRPLMENPNYIGEWEPRTIPNPDYKDDIVPSNLLPIGGIGFELWTMDKNILFDNIYLGHSIEEAEKIGNDTFIPKIEAEYELLGSKSTDSDGMVPADKPIYSDLYNNIMDYIGRFLYDLQEYVADVVEAPLKTLGGRPGEAVFFSFIMIGVFGTVVSLWTIILNILGSLLGSVFSTTVKPKTKSTIKYTNKKAKKHSNLETVPEKKSISSSVGSDTHAKKR